MLTYDKTELGIETLHTRATTLNARQRRLLLLIGSDDFTLLNDTARQRFAPPELLQQLLDLGLIRCNTTTQASSNVVQDAIDLTHHQKIDTPNDELFPSFKKLVSTTEHLLQKIVEPKAQETQGSLDEPQSTHQSSALTLHQTHDIQQNQGNVYDAEAQTIESLAVLSIEDVKFVMMQTLHQHCGLMSRQLIQNIRHAPDLKSLKLCQIQWLTHLQETRIAAQELNQILRQINLSLKN